jgi:DNA anti-recombination protein RmuC
MGDITKEEVRERLGNIDQIRDIIFGAQLRDYNNRLDKLEYDLSLLQQDVRDNLEQVKASFSTELKKAMEPLEKKLKSFNSAAQEESADLRQQVDRVSKKVSGSIEALDEAIDTQTKAIRDELTQTKTKLQDDTAALRDLVLEELDRRFSQLRETKVSKDDIAETLFELGMRLKGTEFIPKLKEAVDNGNAPVPLLETKKHAEELVHSN